MNKQLFRSRRNKMIAGVCGGFAEYFNIDPTVARIILVAIGLATAGTAIIVYVIAAIVMPEARGEGGASTGEGPGGWKPSEDWKPSGDWKTSEDWKPSEDWNGTSGHDSQKNRNLVGIIFVLLGVVFLGKQLFHWIDVKYFLPVILIIIGGFIIYRGRRDQV